MGVLAPHFELEVSTFELKPDGGESGLYTFCADHLERKLFERDAKHEAKRKMKRENTFSLYATDSDSGKTENKLCSCNCSKW